MKLNIRYFLSRFLKDHTLDAIRIPFFCFVWSVPFEGHAACILATRETLLANQWHQLQKHLEHDNSFVMSNKVVYVLQFYGVRRSLKRKLRKENTEIIMHLRRKLKYCKHFLRVVCNCNLIVSGLQRANYSFFRFQCKYKSNILESKKVFKTRFVSEFKQWSSF